MVDAIHYSAASVEHSTPDSLYVPLHHEFLFTLDAAAADDESVEAFSARRARAIAKADATWARLNPKPGTLKHAKAWAAWHRAVASVQRRRFNAKCPDYFTAERSALTNDWRHADGRPSRVFVNPPYGLIVRKFLNKARLELRCGNADVVVFVVPARTDTVWFHQHLWDDATHRPRPGVQLRFRRGRDNFGDATDGAPFPTLVAVMRRADVESSTIRKVVLQK